MARFVFPEVSIRGRFSWKDSTGNCRTETRKCFQTINPFNKNPDGSVRTKDEIISSLKKERDAWIEQKKAEAGDE